MNSQDSWQLFLNNMQNKLWQRWGWVVRPQEEWGGVCSPLLLPLGFSAPGTLVWELSVSSRLQDKSTLTPFFTYTCFVQMATPLSWSWMKAFSLIHTPYYMGACLSAVVPEPSVLLGFDCTAELLQVTHNLSFDISACLAWTLKPHTL